MKAHTNDFKEEIKKLGRQLDSKITYTIDNQEIELGSEDLNSVTPHYESNILKSVSKQLDVDSNIDIPVGTIINYQFGLLVNGAYEYINYGNYIVYKSEKQEDTNSYLIKCYDKMLYAMKDYENLNISYPITIKDYLVALCTKLGLTLATSSFVNDTKEIQSERYLDSEGNSLGYTYRDVLDEIAEVTASTILINDNDEVELRYIEDDQYATDTKIGGNKIYIPDAKEQENIISYSVDGATEQQTYSGKNLLDISDITNITGVTNNNNLSITLNGTPSSTSWNLTKPITLVANKTYTLSLTNTISGTAASIGYSSFILRNGSTNIMRIYFTDRTLSYTPTENTTINTIRIFRGDNYTFNNYTFSIQLEEGSATSYEPYVGGTPSPNPDYPQEVKTIPSIINLFNASKQEGVYGSTTYTVASDGLITQSATDSTTWSPTQAKNFTLNPGTYTISITGKNSNTYMQLRNITDSTDLVLSRSSQATFVITEQKQVGFKLYGGGSDAYPQSYYVMLEKGSVAHEYVPYGYWSRVKVTGKNIFNGIFQQGGINFGNNGANSSSTIRIRTDFIEVQPNTTYTISNNNTNINNVGIGLYKEDKTYDSSHKINNGGWNDFSKSFTTQSDTKYVRFTFRKSDDSTITPDDDYEIQLEQNTATAYEPYKENQVLIDMSKENLFDKNNPNVLNAYFTASATTITSGSSDKTIYIPCKPSTTYTISKKSSPNARALGYMSTTPTIGGTVEGAINIPTNYTFGTITTGANANYLVLRLWNVGQDSGVTFDEMASTLKIYESNNPTPYYELCKSEDGTVKDILSIDSNGNCSINKSFGKYVLNGSESGWNVRQGSNTNLYVFYMQNNLLQNSIKESGGYSNYFIENTTPGLIQYDGGFRITGSTVNYLYLCVNNSIATTTSNFKTWLSTHLTEVYYPLATPETINLSNTKIPLFEGINHITFVDNLETSTSVTYTMPEIGGEIIDEEYLKDINVNFGEEYGSINTIVLSRSAGADKISQSIPSDLPDNEKVSIVIEDNQILNGNDRDIFIPEILNKLYGLHYYLNDFSSTGITYLDICDRYHVKVGDSLYSCVMFNDEIDVTQGLQELIHTDMPETSETDYKKTDKTDQRINQTYLIVDKQNQTIESVVSNVTEQNSKISQITQTVDEINQKIGEITDITVSGESLVGDVLLNQINVSEPITIKVRPLNASNNISYLYPNSSLYPSDTLYSKNRKVRFIRTYTESGETHTENIDYELPDDLLYYDNTHYDEFYLNYDSQTCQVTKKCKYNSDGTVGLLSQEEVIDYPYPTISIGDGNYEIKLLGYDVGYLYVTLMTSNAYTTQFATKVEMESSISQTAQQIELEVSQTLSTNYSTTAEMNSAISLSANEINSEVRKKVGNNEVISKINQTPETITINANKINIAGTITAINNNTTTTINGSKITTGSITANQLSSNSITADKITANTITASKIADATITGTKIADATITSAKISSVNADKITAGTITTSSINLGNGKFSVNTNGYLQSTSGTIGGWTISSSSLSVSWGSYSIRLGADGITASNQYGSITAHWDDILRRLGYLP